MRDMQGDMHSKRFEFRKPIPILCIATRTVRIMGIGAGIRKET